MIRRRAVGLLVCLMLSSARAADPPPALGDAVPVEQELATIREQLVALDIETAQIALNEILERPFLPEASRVEALDLRAQAYVASDDLDAAEADYRALLELRAGYAPGREVTSKKAMERFLKLQAAMIGMLRIDLDPKDASITVDGRAVALAADGALPVRVGERTLHIARKGFDAQDVVVQSAAGRETPVTVRLIPNARSLVVCTDIEGVRVRLDGLDSGLTARAQGAVADAGVPAVLVIEDVSIGEHDLRLEKPCFATESLHEIVSVDLADRSPKLLRAVTMREARTRVTVTGASYPGELRVDHQHAALLPLTSFAMCPGRRTLEVLASGRIVWSGELTGEESDLTVDLAPRPNAVLLGGDWPGSWAEAKAAFSLHGRLDPPPGVDLTTSQGWDAVTLPPGTDLALAVLDGAGVADDQRIVLYSPALQVVEDRASPPSSAAPRWSVATLGAMLVDSAEGAVIVTSTSPEGPAARAGLLPGERIVAIAGRIVANAASAHEAIAASAIGATLVLDVSSPSGPARKLACATAAEPRLPTPIDDEKGQVVGAAWALVNAAAGTDAATAFANLAILLERSGRDAAALEAWRRVQAIGSGVLAARAAYAIGAGLQADGKRPEAIEALGRARAEAIQSGDRALASAASDRLADLGVAPR